MSNTPIFDSLTQLDQKVVDHHVSGLINRSIQLNKEGHTVPFDSTAATEKTAGLLKQNGATATYLRAAFDAAYPRQERAEDRTSLSR